MASDAQNLFQELLRNANGDVALARTWMLQMGYPNPEQFRAETPRTPFDKPELQAEMEATAPRHFFCPIGLYIMHDPVVLSSGQTYDRSSIERWLAQGRRRCPVTQQILPEPISLVPNVVLRHSIEDWAARRAPWLLDAEGRLRPPDDDNTDNFLSVAASAPSGFDVRREVLRRQAEEHDRARMARSVAAAATTGAVASAAAAAAVASAPPGLGPHPAASATGAGLSSGNVINNPAFMSAPELHHQELSHAGGAPPLYPPVAAPAFLPPPPPPPQLMYAAPDDYVGSKTLVERVVVGVEIVLLCCAWIAIYILTIWQNDWDLANLVDNPWAGAGGAALLRMGAQSHGKVAEQGQGWRIISSPFVSAGVIQLVPNLMMVGTFAWHLETVLPRPAIALPAIVLFSSWVGALTSANLNVYYVTTGSTAAIAALLGGMWVELGMNRHLYQLHWVSALILFLTTGVLGTLSVLPYQDFWYLAAAFCSGAVLTGAALTIARRPKNRGSLPSGRGKKRTLLGNAMLFLSLLLLVGGTVVAAVGVGVKSSAGESCGEACAKLSCAPLDWWLCSPYPSRWVGSCGFGNGPGGNKFVQCVTGQQIDLPVNVTSSIPALETLAAIQLCYDLCATGGQTNPTVATPPPGASLMPAPPPPPNTVNT